MKKNDTSIEELSKTINKLICKNVERIKEHGLMNGKAGIGLYLYTYAGIRQDKETYSMAHNLLEEIWNEQALYAMPINFSSGQLGIGFLFQFLMEKKIVTIDSKVEEVLKIFDKNLIYQRLQIPASVDFCCNLFTYGIYTIKRYKTYDEYEPEPRKEYFLYKLILREQIIYQIDECERILYGKSAFNNLLVPKWSIKLLNSFLYFTLVAHSYNIFPHKTTTLLNYIAKLSRKIVPFSDIIDIPEIITLVKLIEKASPYLTSDYGINYSLVRNFIEGINEYQLEDLFKILSQAGFNSIIYENPEIFIDTFNLLSEQDITSCERLNKYLKKNKTRNHDLSLNGLSSIGYGLLLYAHHNNTI